MKFIRNNQGLSPIFSSHILLIDKPKGITSFDVIRILRKKLGIHKMGHAGTLDPLATGLMIIATGSKTKELNNFLKLDKIYIADILLGTQTDTGDITGKIIKKKKVKNIDINKIKNLKGDIKLLVPYYSAIKHKGKPLYKYARENKKIKIKKDMFIYYLKIISLKDNILKIKIKVKSGTYIRSIAEEIGRQLGTVATIKNLRRIQIGEYKIKKAMTLQS